MCIGKDESEKMKLTDQLVKIIERSNGDLSEYLIKPLKENGLVLTVTRAREELYVICEPESFTKGITSQRIKGETLAEKAEFFKGKLTAGTGGYVK